MRFSTHYLPNNKPHAFLSASKYHWINYSDDKLIRAFSVQEAAKRGTELHTLARDLIHHKIKLPDTSATLNLYVNDAIGFQLTPEQVLYYSENCYGTADAIGFRRNKLRISDLKTGIAQTTFKQHMVYAAMFCLEYKFKPFDIEIELRIYQSDEVRILIADPDEITHIMDKIRTFDAIIKTLREEAM